MVEIAGYLVAFAPFVVAGIALIWLGWSAAWSGFATLAAALAGAVLWPGFEIGGVGGALLGGLGTSGRVLYVLFGGLLLYNFLFAGGAIERLSKVFEEVEPDREMFAVGVVVGVAPFFESVTGFGVGVVISAPLLLAAGFSPLKAAVLASWGQCAVPWGALGIGTVIGADLSGTTFERLSDGSAALNLPLYAVYAISALLLSGGVAGIKRHGVEAAVLGLVAGVGTLLTSLYLIPELSGAAGGIAATAVFLILRRARLSGVRIPVRSLAPYALLVALIVLLAEVSPSGAVLEGPGLPLLLSAGSAAFLFGLRRSELVSRIGATVRQWFPTAASVLTFVLAGQVVASSGEAESLAGLAASAGDLYPVAAGVLGAAGGALTGSNAASNALFMPLQAEAARSLGAPEALVAAVQNVSGSHASMLAPQRVVLAAAAVGLGGREGEIVRGVLAPVAVSVVIVCFVALLLG